MNQHSGTHFPRYETHGRFLITINPLPQDIDTSADIDVHFNSNSSHNILPQIYQHQLAQENKKYKIELILCQEQINSLTEQVNHQNQFINNLNCKLEAEEQTIHDLRVQLSQQTHNDLEDQLEHSQAAKHMHTALNNKKQTNTNIQKQLKETQTKLKITVKELQNVSDEMERMNSAIWELTTQLINQSKEVESLVYEIKDLQDENGRLKRELRTLTSRDEATSLITKYSGTKYSGRFKINRPPFECVRCHQAFDSQSEMETSLCSYHLATPSPTATSGHYYYKCCKMETVGKSRHGCTRAKHVSKMNERDTISSKHPFSDK